MPLVVSRIFGGMLAVCLGLSKFYSGPGVFLVGGLSKVFVHLVPQFSLCVWSPQFFAHLSSFCNDFDAAAKKKASERKAPSSPSPPPGPAGLQVCIYESSEWLIDDATQIMKVHVVIISSCWKVWPLHSIAPQPELSSHLMPHLSGLTVSQTTGLRSIFCFQVNLLIRIHCVYLCLFCIFPRAILLSWNQSPDVKPHPCSDTAPP